MEIPPEISASLVQFDQDFPPLAQAAHQALEDLRNRHAIFEQRISSALKIAESGARDGADSSMVDELKSAAHFQREWVAGYSRTISRMLDRLYDELVLLYSHKTIYAKALWDALGLDSMVSHMRERISFMEGLRDQLPRLFLADADDIEVHSDAVARTGEVMRAVTHSTAYLMRIKVSLWSGEPLPQRNS